MSSSLDEVFVLESDIPKASSPVFQHLLNTYASEVNKLVSVWRGFSPGDLAYRPHPRSTIVGDIFKHELLSSRRFFGEFLGLPVPSAAEVLPAASDPEDYCRRLVEVALTPSTASLHYVQTGQNRGDA